MTPSERDDLVDRFKHEYPTEFDAIGDVLAKYITAAVAEERERCIAAVQSQRCREIKTLDWSGRESQVWNRVVDRCIRAMEEQPNGNVQ